MRQALPVLLLLLVCTASVCAEDPVSGGVIYVQDSSRSDPRPGDPSVSDPCEDGTFSHPFDAIQEAIDAAADGATIWAQGTYHETIDLLGKHVTLTGFYPDWPGHCAWPTLDGGGAGPIVTFTHGEDANCVLSGFVITGPRGRSAEAILCSGSSPTIANCLIVGNVVSDPNGAVVRCVNSGANFVNCTITDNWAGRAGAALRLIDSNVTVINSILRGNSPVEIVLDGAGRPEIRYCDVAGGWQGLGCIDVDPLFTCVGEWISGQRRVTTGPDDPNATWLVGDYHLQSQIGHYSNYKRPWTLDHVTSPCIDAGDPCSPVGCELPPNGGVVNLGVYGGTTEASKSCPDAPVHFSDANLKAAVEQELWLSDPTPIDMLGLIQLIQPNLYTRHNGVTDLTGLEYAVNLQELNLTYHKLTDLSPLAGLGNLDTVMLKGNYISDISPLSGLYNLRTLDLEQNQVTDISALASLTNLESLGLHRNFVSDVSPLANLTHLTWVDLRALPLNAQAYSTYLSQIEANNPGMTLEYDAPFTGRLIVSTTAGGTVIRPGLGVFAYAFYEVVVLEAQADPGYEFVGWSGSYSSTDNPLSLTMDQDYELKAVFRKSQGGP